MAELPPARLVPKDHADQRVVARAAVGRGVRRGVGLTWQLIKLAVIGVLLVAVVGVALHVLQEWGSSAPTPPGYDELRETNKDLRERPRVIR